MWIHNALTKYETLNTADPGEARRVLEKLICPHSLVLNKGASNLDVKYCDYDLGSVHLGYLKYGAPVSIDIDNLTTRYILKLPLHGQSSTSLGRQESKKTDLSYGAVLSPEQVFKMRFNEDYEEVLVSINRALLDSQFYKLTGVYASDGISFDLTFDLQRGVGCAIRELVQFLIGQTEYSRSVLSPQMVKQQFTEMFANLMLTGLEHSNTGMLQRSEYKVRPRAIKQAADYIENHYTRPITVSEISDHVDVNIRSLQAGFKRTYDMTPKQYLKELRLTKLRERLLQADPPDSVTDLIIQSGFSHLGRCAIEYRKRFGESPSETFRNRR